MNKAIIQIWGRKFEIGIIFDCYAGEEILDSQYEAISAFLQATDSIEVSLAEVKSYCLAKNPLEIKDNICNIFKYVMPEYLYVSRKTDSHIVSIMCNYRFDQDNGIAVVFENETLSKIGTQDIIL